MFFFFNFALILQTRDFFSIESENAAAAADDDDEGKKNNGKKKTFTRVNVSE